MWQHCSHMCLDVVTLNEYLFISDWAMIKSSDAHLLSRSTNLKTICWTVSSKRSGKRHHLMHTTVYITPSCHNVIVTLKLACLPLLYLAYIDKHATQSKSCHRGFNITFHSCLCLYNLRLHLETMPTHDFACEHMSEITYAFRTSQFMCFSRKGEFACQLHDEVSSFRFGFVDFFEHYINALMAARSNML